MDEDIAQIAEEDPQPTPEELPQAPASTLRALAQLYQISPRTIMWVGALVAGLVCFGLVKSMAAGRRSAAQTEAEMASWRLFRSKSPQQLDEIIKRFIKRIFL